MRTPSPAVTPIAGHGAEGDRQGNLGQDKPDAVWVLDLHPDPKGSEARELTTRAVVLTWAPCPGLLRRSSRVEAAFQRHRPAWCVVAGLQQRRCRYRMETVMRSAIHSRLVAVGVEEEFHIVDLATRRLTGQADRLMGQLPADRFSWEMQRSVVEANSRPWASLAELAEDIAGLRQAAIAAAEPLGLGIVAAGTVPLADPGTLQVTADPRYEHIRGEYRMLVREQLICSTQVHVDVDDRDLAIAVGRRVAPWLPALLALSASSPFWLGTDTGYASYRTLIWRRWPTAGALPGFESAAEYDRAVADLVRSGVILDPGMIYFDVRPSAHLPTLELRICDSCPSLEDVVLLAGLFRALVIREAEAEHAGRPPVPVRPGLLEAATWRAAQAGLQGELVDPVTAGPVPAGRLIGQLLTGLRPALESTGDWELVSQLARSAMARGSSAARQRAAHGSGGARRVVDTLIAETRAVPPWLQGARRVA